jgi:rRNA maturation protein Nop10
MKSLTLHPLVHGGSGPDIRNWKTALKYEVEGLPPGEKAWIAKMNHSWRILTMKDGVQGKWTGKYKSAEDALAALASPSAVYTFSCPHCGRQTEVFGADRFDSIDMGRETCTQCGQEFLIVNDIPMTEQQYRDGSKIQ